MTSKTMSTIPRFLLPQHGPIWRATTTATTTTRPVAAAFKAAQTANRSRASSSKSAAARAANASAPTKPPHAKSSSPSSRPGAQQHNTETARGSSATDAANSMPASLRGPIVLEKPERFNPPSHGRRLPRSTPRHYGGAPSEEEIQAQRARSYPGLPPPPNTWSHWFINSRGVHLFITLGTLTSLCAYTFAANFQSKSPYADLIPPASEFWRHPLQYAGACLEVLRLHEAHEAAASAERRRRRNDDVAKRNEYRRAHGLDPATGFLGGGVAASDGEPAAAAAAVGESADPNADDGKRKRFLGIF